MNATSAGNPALLASDKERKIIVSTFKENESLLKAIRAVFLNLSPTPEEIKLVQGLAEEVKAILRDRFLPRLDKQSPIGQVKDEWLGAEQMVMGQNDNMITQSLQYKERALKMTEQMLGLLDGGGHAINLAYNPVGDILGINLITRNQVIRHVEGQLYALWVIANQKNETPVQAAKRAVKDSAR